MIYPDSSAAGLFAIQTLKRDLQTWCNTEIVDLLRNPSASRDLLGLNHLNLVFGVCRLCDALTGAFGHRLQGKVLLMGWRIYNERS